MVNIPQRVLNWAAYMKQKGNEIRFTKNGHPYAMMRPGAKRKAPILQSIKRKK